jgi:hypothetical protein
MGVGEFLAESGVESGGLSYVTNCGLVPTGAMRMDHVACTGTIPSLAHTNHSIPLFGKRLQMNRHHPSLSITHGHFLSDALRYDLETRQFFVHLRIERMDYHQQPVRHMLLDDMLPPVLR